MKPLFPIVVALLVFAANAHSETTKNAKELPQTNEPVVEAEDSEAQARPERCTTCSGTQNLKSHKNVLAALQDLPAGETHTQESFEECSSENGCAGIKLKDGKLVERFGNFEAFKAAAAANAGNEFQFQAAGNSVFEGGVPNGGPFWWMNQNSPFKKATGPEGAAHLEKVSKFQSSSFSSSTGNGDGGVDIAANPFLNGDFSKLSGGFTSSGGNFAAGQGGQGAGFGAGFGAGQAGFGTGSQNFGNSQSFAASQNGFTAQGGQGGLTVGGLGSQGSGGGQNYNYNTASKFASTGYTGSSPAPFAGGANVNLIQNTQKADFDFDQQQQTQQSIDEVFQSTGNVLAHEAHSGGDLQQTCAGQGYICVHKAQCNNGVVNTNGGALPRASTQRQYCNTRTEVCCRLETIALPGTGTLQGTLGVGSATFSGSSSQGTGLFAQSGSGQNGFQASGSSGTSAFGSGSSQTTNTGFNSVNRGTAGFGTSTNQFSGAGGSQFGSSFANTNKYAGTTVGAGFGSTLAPNPTRFAGNNFNNEVYKTTSQSNFVETDSFSAGSENTGVYRPGAVGLKPGLQYLPSVDTATSGTNVVSTAFVTTPRPYTTPRPVYTPRPFTTVRPFSTVRPTYRPLVTSTSAPGYLPPVELDGSESRPHYVDGGLILDETLPGPTVPVKPKEIPSGCAAALKCTPIEYCTADGVISNTSVILSRDQEVYRVPLTNCKDLSTGQIGKCCRDPYYTDPWPVNQLGKWVPDVFGGNDGRYTPDSRGSPNNPRPVVTARPPVTGSVILNNFRTTQRPTLPQGPNQVTPGYPTQTLVPGSFVKTTVTQGGRGQYEQGGRGVGIIQGQGQYGQAGRGQLEIVGQGIQGNQGSGFRVTQGTQGIFGTGQTVSQERGTAVTQQFGSGVTQGQGLFGSQGQGQIISQEAGQGATFGVGNGFRQGTGFGVTQGQGVGFGFGAGQTLLEGQGQALIQGQGEQVTQESVHRVFLTRYDGAGKCGQQNPQKPYGNRQDLEVDFSEIPWQAMVLLGSNKSLLCGGVITRPDVVITSASCVEGLRTSDVLIKGGEWKLGIDEEPQPFQIVKVKNILRHPYYQAGSLKYDAAILVLTENLRFAKNIGPICLPSAADTLDGYYNGAGECIVTGWGKNVLQAHILGSIMHGVNVSLVNPGECQLKLQQDYPHLLDNYDQDSCVCGQPTNPTNNICRVDTGSALACTTGNGIYELRGIYSFDSGCQVGNQLAGFYKFDVEWYEWAIGLIESVRFAQYSTATFSKNKVVSQVTGSRYSSGLKGATSGVKGAAGSGIKGFGLQGQTGIKGFGLEGQTQSGEYSQFGKITGTNGAKFAGSGENAGINFGTDLNGPLSNSFSATYTEKKFFQSEPKYVTYTTKPEIVTYTTKPEYFTYTTKPKIVTYTTKPKIVSYTTKPQFITYETSGSVTNPKYVSPGLSFSEVVGAKHTHSAQCKCLENGKK